MTDGGSIDPALAQRSLARRLLRWGVRGALVVMLLMAVLLTAGFMWERVASARFTDDFPPPGRIVTLDDGRALHFVVKGEGEPTLVLQSGAGGPYTDWSPVFNDLAETTRVIAYDRPGYGWSDPSETTSAASITADLHEGLAALDVAGPIVLVGHSVGGFYVRHHASVHPDRVVGLVLVDSSHEEQLARVPTPVAEMMESMQTMMKAMAFGSQFGLLRALHAAGAHPMLAADASPRRVAMMNRSAVLSAIVREYGSFATSMAQVRAVAAPFGDLPIVVLSATEPPRGIPPEMEQHLEAMQAAWREMQAELAELSTNARHVSVADAGHYVQFDRPDVVVGEITAMIDAIRADEPLAPVEQASAN